MNPSLFRFTAVALACVCSSIPSAPAQAQAAPVVAAPVAQTDPAPTPAPDDGAVPPPAAPVEASPVPAPPPAPAIPPAPAATPSAQTAPPGYAPNYPPPGYAPQGYDARYPGYPPPAPRLSRGMMITGIAILGGTYGLSALLGLVALDADNCSDCDEVGPPLLIPVFGPFIAASQADEAGGVFAMLGIAQAVGAGLMIGGIVKYKNSKARAREQGYVVELSRGRTLALDASTSPKLTGPRLTLKF